MSQLTTILFLIILSNRNKNLMNSCIVMVVVVLWYYVSGELATAYQTNGIIKCYDKLNTSIIFF